MSSRQLTACFALLATTTTALAEPARYDGLCEASAATIIGDSHFAVASDDMDRVAVYRRGFPDPIAWSDDLGKVGDIEAAAKIDNVTFWITSHSLTKKGKDKDKRKKLLATVDINGTPVEIGDKFETMRDVLGTLLQDRLDPETVTSAETSTLNIEGMTTTPNGALILGLRSPLDADGRALVINIGQPHGLLALPERDAPATMATRPVTALDLGGRGIRSIERFPGTNRYLIIAGAAADTEAEFAVFRWDGAETVQEVKTAVFDGPRPEALIIWPDGIAQVLGDNGGANCSDDKDDVGTGPRWFPSVDINLVE